MRRNWPQKEEVWKRNRSKVKVKKPFIKDSSLNSLKDSKWPDTCRSTSLSIVLLVRRRLVYSIIFTPNLSRLVLRSNKLMLKSEVKAI